MKRLFIITLILCLSFFISTASAIDATRLGPKQYDRTNGKPNDYTDTFRAYDDKGKIIVQNGDPNGDHRISSAVITLNGQTIFTQNQFNQNVDRLEAAVDLNEINTLTVELKSKPGSYLTIKVIQDVEPPTANIFAEPNSIIFEEESATLSWRSTNADTINIDQGIGQVGPTGSVTVSPEETTIYTVKAVNDGGTTTSSATLTVIYLPPTTGISANPESMLIGTSSTLSWNSTRADTAVIDNGIGAVNVNGSTIVSPTETTTYTIMVTGRGGTATSTATVTVYYPPPIIDISANPVSILLGESTTLSWSSTYADTVVIDNGVGSVPVNGPVSVSPTETTTYTMTATGPGGISTATITIEVIQPPSVDISADPPSIYKGDSTSLSWTSANADTCTIEPGIGTVPVNGSISVSPEETTTYTIMATGPGGATTDTVTINVEDPAIPPTITFNASPTTIPKGGSATISWSTEKGDSAYIDNGVGNVSVNGSVSVSPSNTTTYTITVSNTYGNTSAQATVYVTGNPQPQPEGHFGEQYEDLTPPDATITKYDPQRFALIAGFVQAIDETPIADVSINILGHPEYGTVFTNANGNFTIPVEGGGVLTVVYSKPGLLSAQRQVDVPWNDIGIAETVQMIEQDSTATTVTFDGSADTIITHQSSVVTDEFGSRSCSVVFAGNNKVYLVNENGQNVKQLNTINVRATEYTTEESMPAKLPPNSAYTYCVELEVDGAKRIKFQNAVMMYVDNFLGFPVGQKVPVGYYDRDKGVWIPEKNGRVVRLLDTDSDGIVDALDYNGNNLPNDLNNNGSFADEVKGLDDPSRYTPGSTYWRVSINHFSPIDTNWPYGPPKNSIASNAKGEPSTGDKEPVCLIKGTLVNTAKGLKPIEKIVKGDYVLSKDKDSTNPVLQKVTRTSITPDKPIIELKIKDSKGIVETFGATPEHPFWTQNRGWIAASDLQKDEKVYSLKEGWITLAGSEPKSSKKTVYNIEVEGFHTYFVGRNGIWVHNTCKAQVDPRKRTINERIAIPGTGMAMHYVSSRTNGHQYVITVPASGDILPNTLKRIVVSVEVAGRKLTTVLDPLPNQMAEFIWDGKDHLGRPVGTSTVHIAIDFVYDAVYWGPGYWARSFAKPGSSGGANIRARQEAYIRKTKELVIDSIPKLSGEIAEGWTLSHHHLINAKDHSALYKGDGSINKNSALLIDTIAGQGQMGGCLTREHVRAANKAPIHKPRDIEVDRFGNIYILGGYGLILRKIDTKGIIRPVAGDCRLIYHDSGDGGPALDAGFYRWYQEGIGVDQSGNVYIADWENDRVRKVDTNGIIRAFAGNGNAGFSGDGGLATKAKFNNPWDVVEDKSGNIYISDRNNHRIRMVDPNGIITTIAGTGSRGFGGDGGPAINARFRYPTHLAIDPHDNLYIVDRDNYRIRKIDTKGIITTVAGSGSVGFSGDGGPATKAKLNYLGDIAVDALGNLYICDRNNYRVRKVDTTGIIQTIAGTGAADSSGDGGPPTSAKIYRPSGIAVDEKGDIYIAGTYVNKPKIRKVTIPSGFEYFSVTKDILFTEGNGIGHIMSNAGMHKKTIDLNTNVAFYTFSYDSDKNLSSITDQFNNPITIERDGSGVPTAIISPDGLRTELSINSNNHLTRITYPDSSHYDFEYTPDGLMTAEVEPKGNRFEYVFDATGRLTDASDEEGGHWNYQRTTYIDGNIEKTVTTGEGNATSYVDRNYSSGAYRSTITDPTEDQIIYNESANGMRITKSDPCGMNLRFDYGIDSRYSTKYVTRSIETAPSGKKRTANFTKAYQDTNSDNKPDVFTETVTINSKATTIKDNTNLSQMIITSHLGRTVTSFYDPDTLVTDKVSTPGLYDTNYFYNSKGRLTSIQTNTRESVFTYNSQGFLESITDPENNTTTYIHDPLGRVTGINRPDGSSIGFTHDQNGNMTVLTNPASIDHIFEYNSVNKNSSYQTTMSGTYSYVYDKDRRLIRTNFPSGYSIYNIYDKTQLVQIQTPEDTIDITYLCGTKVESITNGTDTITYGYDGSMVTSETLAGNLNQVLGYTYNNDFNLTSFTYAGSTASYSYDNDGLITGAGGYAITRNAQNGLPESVIGGTLNIERSFNGFGEVETLTYAISSQNAASWDLIRDNNGRITQKTEVVGGVTDTFDYTYDSTGRLLSVIKNGVLVEEYQYDLKGTRNYEMNSLRGITGKSFTYSDEDHLFTAGSASYNYDVDGFLVSKTDGTNVTQYSYSTRGELLSVTLPDSTQIEYLHDPLGRRIAKIINGAVVEKYLWQGLTRLLAVYDGSDNLLMRFQYADARMPVAMTKQGVTYYLTYDQVGSLRVVADSAGNVVKRIGYDSFGNIINDTNPSFTIPFGFAGGLHDRNTGLIKFGFRDYDPDIGRWTAKDPIGFAGGDTDLYGYVLNNPVNKTDPEGLWTFQLGFGMNIGAGVGKSNSKGIAISYNPKNGKWEIGLYGTIGGGLHLGANADVVIDVIVSDNNCLQKLSGWSSTTGGSINTPTVGPHAGVGFESNAPIGSNAKPSYTFSGGVGIGLPGEGHSYITYTGILQIFYVR